MTFATAPTEPAVVSVAGAKGGVGKTTSAINLAASMTAAGASVAVVETDLAMANLLDFLEVGVDADADPTLLDVLADDAPAPAAVYDAPGGFDVVPAGFDLERYADIDPERLPAVVDDVAADYDVVLLDVGAGVSYETVLPLGLADRTVLVSSPRVASVRDAEKTKQIVERVGGSVTGALFVRAGTGNAPPPERIARYVGVDLLGHVPDDPTVPAAQDAGVPAVSYDEEAPASRAYGEAARALLTDGGEDEPDPRESAERTL